MSEWSSKRTVWVKAIDGSWVNADEIQAITPIPIKSCVARMKRGKPFEFNISADALLKLIAGSADD